MSDNTNTSAIARTDLYRSITQRVIAAIEAGTPPWVCPWDRTGGGLPFNFRTEHHYSGVNVLLLWMAASDRGFGSNAWLTLKQANALGGHVRKGERGSEIIFYNVRTVTVDGEDSVAAPDGDAASETRPESRKVPFIRTYRVFNAEQLDGIDFPRVASPSPVAIIDAAFAFVENTGASVRESGTQAFYSRDTDTITVPPIQRFTRPEDFHATLHHELVHWTGHPDRMARTFGKRFGDAAYAVEELVAELGSAFIDADLGIEGQVQGHASYLDHWLTVLKADKYALFRAAGDAARAHRFLLDLQPEARQQQAA